MAGPFQYFFQGGRRRFFDQLAAQILLERLMRTGRSLTQNRMGLFGHVFDLHTRHDSHFGASGATMQLTDSSQ